MNIKMTEPNWEGTITFKFYTFEDREHAISFIKGMAKPISSHPNVKEVVMVYKKLTPTEIKE